MFRTLYALPRFIDLRNEIFLAHPTVLVDYLEQYWRHGGVVPPAPGLPAPRPEPFLDPLPAPPDGPSYDTYAQEIATPDEEGHRGWWGYHLIYAYMVENTRIEQIFRKVVHEFSHGEGLGIADELAQAWLRATEMLLFHSAPPDSIYGVDSHIRPDHGAIRRNAYYRMFGLDLNHGTADNRPYPYIKPAVANRDFVGVFESLLREVWVGIMHRSILLTTANPTDDAGIADHIERLCAMLTDRKHLRTLAREEFYAVATMSWLHLAVEVDSPIVVALKAEATSPYERLRRIGARVGMAPHSKSLDYFAMADDAEDVLLAIETGDFNDPVTARGLYADPTCMSEQFQRLITHWSSATGRDLKAPALYRQARAGVS